MKNLFTLLLIFLTSLGFSQVLLTDQSGEQTPDAYAVLELKSADKGLLLPRLNDAPSPVEGLIFFDQKFKCLKGYDGTKWQELGNCLSFIHNFETSPANQLPMTADPAGTYFDDNGDTPYAPMYASGERGYGKNNGRMDLKFGPVDVSAFTNISASFRLASFSTNSSNGADSGDFVNVYVSTDNGLTWSHEIQIRGASNVYYGFNATGIASTDYDNDNNPAEFQSVHPGTKYSTVIVNEIPPSSQLMFRIETINDATQEIWVIDDVEIVVE